MELKVQCFERLCRDGHILLSNPFNGIESLGRTARSPPASGPRNPFNGIERGMAAGAAGGGCLGIHSMELKASAEHARAGASHRCCESIQWN